MRLFTIKCKGKNVSRIIYTGTPICHPLSFNWWYLKHVCSHLYRNDVIMSVLLVDIPRMVLKLYMEGLLFCCLVYEVCAWFASAVCLVINRFITFTFVFKKILFHTIEIKILSIYLPHWKVVTYVPLVVTELMFL